MSKLSFISVTLMTLLLHHKSSTTEINKETKFNQSDPKNNITAAQTSPVSYTRTTRDILSQSDEYVTRNQKQCFETRNLVSCIKYKAARIVWKLATNSNGFFPNEYARELREDTRRIRLIQLGEPSDLVVFTDARSLEGVLEFVKNN